MTAPANTAQAPPGDYMVYVLDTNNVPSVARIIQLAAPADTTGPSVSITAPAAGATVSGSTSVTANASDNDSVAGVQFKLDGANLGAEDTAAPYSRHLGHDPDARTAPHSLTPSRATSREHDHVHAVAVTVRKRARRPASWPPTASTRARARRVTDRSGQRRTTATITGADRTTAGKFGSALTFDGVNDIVTSPTANSLDLTSGMTLEAWVRPTTLGSNWRTVLLKEQTGNYVYGLYAHTGTNAPERQRRSSASDDRDVRGTAQRSPLNTWTHLATTYDGTDAAALRQRRPGLAASRSPGAIATSTGALRIGGNNDLARVVHGQIDEVRIYNRALSAARDPGRHEPERRHARRDPAVRAHRPHRIRIALERLAQLDRGRPTTSVSRGTTSTAAPTAGFTPTALNRIAQPTGTSYTDTGLAAGTYYYKVVAEDASANQAAPRTRRARPSQATRSRRRRLRTLTATAGAGTGGAELDRVDRQRRRRAVQRPPLDDVRLHAGRWRTGSRSRRGRASPTRGSPPAPTSTR